MLLCFYTFEILFGSHPGNWIFMQQITQQSEEEGQDESEKSGVGEEGEEVLLSLWLPQNHLQLQDKGNSFRLEAPTLQLCMSNECFAEY